MQRLRDTGAGSDDLGADGSVIPCGKVKRGWADTVLPWLTAHGLEAGVRHFLEVASAPFDPWIRWTVSDAEWAVKFPVNSVELSFIATLFATFLYVVVSLLTCRKPFNLARMLHRGPWADGNEGAQQGCASHEVRPSFAKRLLNHMVGINSEYTREDRFLAWAVFGYNIVYGFLGTFVLVAICAKVFHWTIHAWAVKTLVTALIVPLVFGIVTTVWFTWGTTRDIRRLFRDLETRVRDDRDNGMVEKGGE